ncbi:MAG TPA: DUF1266 domain-containing protein [Polyangiaceae bacterium]|nr:DUF1266 domain-containing protein [Polyangiaceae bacterium]
MSWAHLLWAVFVLVIVAGYYFYNRGRTGSTEGDDGFDQARFLADRSDPRKLWAHAAIALYMDDSDPGCWKRENAERRLQKGWSTPNGAELVELIQRYIQGECNVAFDKLRIIFLARAGRGAGWFDEATSWAYAFNAMTEIQKNYTSWEQLRVAMDEGRADWYGGKDEVPEAQIELSQRGWNKLQTNYMSQVPFYGAQPV